MSYRFLIAGMVAAAPAALVAHHGPLLYDPNPKNMVKLEGPLTEVNWGYPHISAKSPF